MSESDEKQPQPTPTIDEELVAMRAVLEALVKLPSLDAQGRVLHHASMYLRIGGPRW